MSHAPGHSSHSPAPAHAPATPPPAPKSTLPSLDLTKTPEEIKRELEERIKNIGFVDVGNIVESEARDVAESRMNRDREEMTGWKNFFKRVWHNAVKDYKTFKIASKIQEEMYDEGNVFLGKKESDKTYHENAMQAVAERFVSEYDVIRKESGEKRKKLDETKPETVAFKTNIQKFIKEYAQGKFGEAEFDAEFKRLMDDSDVQGLGSDILGEGKMYGSNLRSVALQVKQAVDHGVALDTIDLNFDITLGKASSGVRTEAHLGGTARTIEKINKTLAGTIFANETVVAAGVSLAMYLGRNTLSRAAKTAGFVGGLAVAGAISGMKENTRMKIDYAQHARDRARGKEFDDKDAPRRMAMEKASYELESAKTLSDGLKAFYVDGDPSKGVRDFKTQDEFDAALDHLTEIEGRINLSNKHKIDLIGFSSVKTVESERSMLEIEQARAKVMLRQACAANPAMGAFLGAKTFDDLLRNSTGAFERSMLSGEISKKDKVFRDLKTRAVTAAAAKGVLSALVIGTVIQEGRAFFADNTVGGVEHLFRGNDLAAQHAAHNTPLEQLHDWMYGKDKLDFTQHQNFVPGGPNGVDMQFPGSTDHFRFPPGTEIFKSPNGTVNIKLNGQVLGNNIPFNFNPDGTPTQETIDALARIHVTQTGLTHAPIIGEQHAQVTPREYVAQHPNNVHHILREGHNDNDTVEFDQDELKMDFGGVHNSGLDAQGRFVFNISRMTEDGSFHGDIHSDPEMLAKTGKLSIALSMSRDTQNFVFKVPIDGNGNAIIDPNTAEGKEIAKLFFEHDSSGRPVMQDGHVVFAGRYGEVAEDLGVQSDGREHERIISTITGPEINSFDSTVVGVTQTNVHDFSMGWDKKFTVIYNRDTELPPTIPLVGRKPLEREFDEDAKKAKKEREAAEKAKKEKKKKKDDHGHGHDDAHGHAPDPHAAPDAHAAAAPAAAHAAAPAAPAAAASVVHHSPGVSGPTLEVIASAGPGDITDKEWEAYNKKGALSKKLKDRIVTKLGTPKTKLTKREQSIYKAHKAEINAALAAPLPAKTPKASPASVLAAPATPAAAPVAPVAAPKGLDASEFSPIYSGEEFLKDDLSQILINAFDKYSSVRLPRESKNPLKGLVFRDNKLSGDINLETKGKSGKWTDTKVTGFRLENKGDHLEVGEDYTFVNRDELETTRFQVRDALKDISQAVESYIGSTRGKTVKGINFKDGQLNAVLG
jgi:hypothetical protein